MKNLKNLSTPEIKETAENLFELEKRPFRLKKYYDYEDTEYIGIRDIGNLFIGIGPNGIDENYYKLIKTKSSFNTFNSNYIEHESKGDKNKNLSMKDYLYMTTPYLSDMINYYKTKSE